MRTLYRLFSLLIVFSILSFVAFGDENSEEPQQRIDLLESERAQTRSAYSGEYLFPVEELSLVTHFWTLFMDDPEIPAALKDPKYYWIALHSEQDKEICLSVQWRRQPSDTGFSEPLSGLACFSRNDQKLLVWFMGRYSAFIDESVDPDSITFFGFAKGEKVGRVPETRR